jgi:hypothetical protein
MERETLSTSKPFYFAALIIGLLIVATILCHGFGRIGITLLVVLCLSIYKVYRELGV